MIKGTTGDEEDPLKDLRDESINNITEEEAERAVRNVLKNIEKQVEKEGEEGKGEDKTT